MKSQIDKILTVILENALYGIELDCIREILTIDKVHPLPTSVPYARGAIMVRGNPIPLVDMRMFFGKSSYLAERSKIADILNQRKQDHIDWLNELESCVNENRDFKKATDPTKCAFGVWLESYVPDTPELAREIASFHEPHGEIHEVGIQVVSLIKAGKIDKARIRLAEAREYELKRMLNLFDEIRHYLVNHLRETAIIVSDGNMQCGLIVDAVREIKSRDSFSENDYAMAGITKGVSRVLSNGEEALTVLDVSEVLKELHVTLSHGPVTSVSVLNAV